MGAVGFLPEYAAFLYPVALIKCDEDTGEPLRNKEGWCIKCKPGEAGVFLGKIARKNPLRAFGGYSDKVSQFLSKICTDVIYLLEGSDY